MLIGAGYLLGTQWERVADAIGAVATPLVVLAVLAVAGALILRAVRPRRAHR